MNLIVRFSLILFLVLLSLALRLKGEILSTTTVRHKFFTNTKVDTTNLAKKISWYYDKAIKFKGNNRYRLHFFYLFPKSYKEFISLYGNSDKYGKMPLYADYKEHIDLFCGSSNLNNQKFAAKIVAICIKGKWDADAVNMLQECALNFTNEHTLLIAKELNSYGNNEVKSFWYFLFDGPHPAKVIPINIDKIRSSDPGIYRLAKEAFKQVHQESEKHGE